MAFREGTPMKIRKFSADRAAARPRPGCPPAGVVIFSENVGTNIENFNDEQIAKFSVANKLGKVSSKFRACREFHKTFAKFHEFPKGKQFFEKQIA